MNIATEPRKATTEIWNGAVSSQRGGSCQIAVVGAGPYGLAAAAHLRAAKVEMRAFGDPMSFWRQNMPKGMNLRSPWKGSTIADPMGEYTLDRYVAMGKIKYEEPLPLESFLKYGGWFQEQMVPTLENRKVERVELAAGGFCLVMEDGERVRTQRVLMATGLAKQEHVPAEFAGLPRDAMSHSVEHTRLEQFRGKRVAVIGRGQSAVESAVLLSEAGAEVELISHGPVFWIGADDPAKRRSLKWKLHHAITPPSPVGPLPGSWIIDTPGLLRMLPMSMQKKLATRGLRPAAAAWLAPRSGAVKITAGVQVVSARVNGSRVEMKFDNGAGTSADHVMLATGYKVDISKQGLLAPELLHSIQHENGMPVLGAGYESTVPGLHFAGCTSVSSFGPLMRFIWGAGYAARSLTRNVLAGS